MFQRWVTPLKITQKIASLENRLDALELGGDIPRELPEGGLTPLVQDIMNRLTILESRPVTLPNAQGELNLDGSVQMPDATVMPRLENLETGHGQLVADRNAASQHLLHLQNQVHFLMFLHQNNATFLVSNAVHSFGVHSIFCVHRAPSGGRT